MINSDSLKAMSLYGYWHRVLNVQVDPSLGAILASCLSPLR